VELEELAVQAELVALAELAAQVDQVELVVSAELANQVDQAEPVAVAGLANQVDQVELVGRVALAELAIELAQETVQVAALAGRLQRVLLVVPAKTKSATAAHLRGLVLVRKRAEDLAVAAAAIMPELAAIEAVTVWAAAE
jgi:hypothetical protein